MKEKKAAGTRGTGRRKRKSEQEIVRGKDIGFHTDRIDSSASVFTEEFYDEWLPNTFVLDVPFRRHCSSGDAGWCDLISLIQCTDGIPARSASYFYEATDPDGSEFGEDSERMGHGYFAIDRDRAELLDQLRSMRGGAGMKRIDVRGELGRLKGRRKTALVCHLIQLLFGYADNSAPMSSESDGKDPVYNNVLGHTTVFPSMKTSVWTDTTNHRYTDLKTGDTKFWPGSTFLGDKTLTGLAMRIEDGCLYPSAEPYLLTTKEKAAIANLFNAYRFVDGRIRHYPKPEGIAMYQQGQRQRPAVFEFLKFGSYAEFIETRMGQLALFYRRMRRLIGRYVRLQWWDYSETELHKFSEDKLYRNEQILKACIRLLKGKLSVSQIGDDIPAEDAEAIIRILKERFDFADSELSSGFDDGRYNLVIRHDAEYYKDKKEDVTQKFYRSHPEAAIQGITEESIRPKDRKGKARHMNKDKVLATMLKACIIALAIKGDVQMGRMTVAGLPGHRFIKPLSFAMARRIKIDDKRRLTHYYCMTLDPSTGALSFRCFTYNDVRDVKDENNDNLRIARAFGLDGENYEHNPMGTELAVWEDTGDIYVIRKTSEHVIPDTGRILEALAENEKKKISRSEFEECYAAFMGDMLAKASSSNTELSEYRESIITEFGDKDILNCYRLQKALDAKGNKNPAHRALYKEIIPYLARHLPIKIRNKGSGNARLYGIDQLSGGWWFRTPAYNSENPSETRKDSISYYLGVKIPLENGLSKGIIIRQLMRCNGDEPDMEFVSRILSLMSVDFVRLSQWTVLPFPAKYLREYIDITRTQRPEEPDSGKDSMSFDFEC